MSNLKGKARAYHEGRLARERKRLSKDPGKKRLTGDLKEHAESVYDKNLIAAPAGKEISNSRYWDTLDQIGSGKLSTREAVSSYLHKKGSVMNNQRKQRILEKLSFAKKAAQTATKTDPEKWEQAKRDAKDRMGGKHSARAMQLATQLYKKRGGGYSGKEPTAKSNSLKKWTKQKWQWSGEKKKTAGKGVYLPEAKINRLKSSEEGKKRLAAASRKKAKATRQGKQYSSHGLAAGTSLKSKTASVPDKLKKIVKELHGASKKHKGQAERIQALLGKMKKASAKRDPRLERAGVSGYNQEKRTPGHPTKSHIVVAKEGDRVKTIRFGQQGVKTNQTAGQRKAFKSRHAKNISKGRMSAAYWADKVKWSPSKTKDKKNQKWIKGS
tara:strand:- start:3029 stop:4177 length:1149 start_codon:yes stop_codon:yes gene_type:complete